MLHSRLALRHRIADGHQAPRPHGAGDGRRQHGLLAGRALASRRRGGALRRAAAHAGGVGHGLTLTSRDGGRLHLAADSLQLHRSLPADLTPGLVLRCVKSAATATATATAAATATATATAAVELGGLLPPGTPVVSMQNGIANAAIAQPAAPQPVRLPGMVPFNVAEPAPGHLHRGTAGALAALDPPQRCGHCSRCWPRPARRSRCTTTCGRCNGASCC